VIVLPSSFQNYIFWCFLNSPHFKCGCFRCRNYECGLLPKRDVVCMCGGCPSLAVALASFRKIENLEVTLVQIASLVNPWSLQSLKKNWKYISAVVQRELKLIMLLFKSWLGLLVSLTLRRIWFLNETNVRDLAAVLAQGSEKTCRREGSCVKSTTHNWKVGNVLWCTLQVSRNPCLGVWTHFKLQSSLRTAIHLLINDLTWVRFCGVVLCLGDDDQQKLRGRGKKSN
jgi:hypothetical protein